METKTITDMEEYKKAFQELKLYAVKKEISFHAMLTIAIKEYIKNHKI